MKAPCDLDQNFRTSRDLQVNLHKKRKKLEPRRFTHIYGIKLFLPEPNLIKLQKSCRSNFTVEKNIKRFGETIA